MYIYPKMALAGPASLETLSQNLVTHNIQKHNIQKHLS